MYHCDNVYSKYFPKDGIASADNNTLHVWQEAFQANLGCWSSALQKEWFNISTPSYRKQIDERSLISQDIEEEYKGCWEEGGIKTDALDQKCHWPASHLGFSCDENLRWNYLHEGSNHKKVRHEVDIQKWGTALFHTTWKNPFNHDWAKKGEGYENRGLAPDDKWKHVLNEKLYNVRNDQRWLGTSNADETSICSREQCISNDSTDWAFHFMLGEFCFASWFVIELSLRLYSARSYQKYFKTCSNIFDIFAVVVSVGEAVYLPVLLGGAMYEVWGNPWWDPAVMRAFRLLVTIRFITMQRHFSGLKVIKMTVKKVSGKMKIPLFFFFVFAIVFASFFYIVESGDLFVDCVEGDYEPPKIQSLCASSGETLLTCVDKYNMNAGVCRECPVESWQGPNGAKLTETDGTVDYYNRIFKYNGTCTNFIILAGENGKRLAEPKVKDMLDAVWTMIVTMTTVGYGGFFPLQSLGKICALVAALFGSFYMAMPLTIVGSKFYEIYEDVEDEDHVLDAEMEKIFKKKEDKVKKQQLQVDMNLSLAQLSKLKLKSLTARDRVREMGLHKNEIEQAFDYIGAVDQLPVDHTVEAMTTFAVCHFELMKLMSKHLVHRKKSVSTRDMGSPSILDAGNAE